MARVRVPASALRLLSPIIKKAAALDARLYAVGGCVRDWILGRPTFDLDVVVEGDASPLARLCGEIQGAEPEAFGRFGTLRVVGEKFRFDFAASRRESYPQPASLPVVEPAPLREDLRRRDFTINAMALPLYPGRVGDLVDPFGGLDDLRRRVLRALHDRSFRDDPTRVFRAARFLRRFKMKPEAGLLGHAQSALKIGYAKLLSPHRLAHEFFRALGEPNASQVLQTLADWGYLDLVYPGIRWPSRLLAGDPVERLGAIVLEMGGEGEPLLKSLPIERRFAAPAMEALEVAQSRLAPRAALSPAARRILIGAFPRLPKAALRPVMLGGGDLMKAGLAPGKIYREILEDAARAQWAGEIGSLRGARAWLRRRLIRAEAFSKDP